VYQGPVSVRKESPITGIGEMLGQEDRLRGSTSSSARMAAGGYAHREGILVKELKSTEESPGNPQSMVGYVFTGSPEDTQAMLLKGAIDVGVISTNDYDECPKASKEPYGSSRRRCESETSSFRCEAVSAKACPAISTVYVEMDKSPEGPNF